MSTSPTPSTTSSTKNRKPKSPAAPSYALADCVNDVRKLYDTYGRASFSQAELASTLGISASSGPTGSRVFTFKEYGLISKDGEGFRVTEDFVTLKTAEAGSPDFKRAAYTAVLRAGLFKDLSAAFGSKLPPQANVATRLEGQMKFNPDRAKEIAATFDASLRFAGVVDANGNIVPVRAKSEAATAIGKGDEGKSDGGPSDQFEDESEENNSQALLKLQIPLKDGRKVNVMYPHDLTSDEAKKVSGVLNAIAG